MRFMSCQGLQRRPASMLPPHLEGVMGEANMAFMNNDFATVRGGHTDSAADSLALNARAPVAFGLHGR